MISIIKRKFFTNSNKNINPIFAPKNDDIFLVSYPKSGNTWVRFLLATYLGENKTDFNNVNLYIPDIHFDPLFANNSKRPGIFKSHFAYLQEYKKVVYIVRDSRDVAVSYYFYHLKYKLIPEETSFIDFVNLYNTGKVNFGSWSDHVNSWLDNKPEIFHFVRYEDLKINPEGELIKILLFCNINVEIAKVRKAVEYSNFDTMLKREKDNPHPFNLTSNEKINFMRKGQIGDYKNYFTAEELNQFLNIHGEAMKRIGYI